MAIRDDFAPGEVLASADLNDTFASKLNLAGGKVLQVVSTTKVDTFSTSSTSYTDLTGLSVSITPSSATSKILAIVDISTNIDNAVVGYVQLLRASTAVGGGTAVGTRRTASKSLYLSTSGATVTTNLAFNFLDSPATTSATTYKIQVATNGSPININTTFNDADDPARPRTSSTITLMEISG
jgi:hypothetical protein